MVSKLSEWLWPVLPTRPLARYLHVGGRGVAANHTVATGSFGDVKRLVGGLHQCLPAIAIPRKDRDSQTQREVGYCFAVSDDGLAGHRPPDPFSHRDRRPTVRAPQHEHELIASIARHEISRPDGRHQDLAGQMS